MKKKYSNNQKQGITLLIAILVASVMLAVGIGVYQRTYKSITFSSYWEQSQIAFSAADAGLECALFNDLHPLLGSVNCFGSSGIGVPGWIPGSPGWTPGNTGAFWVNTPSGGCVKVTITVGVTTLIESRGYNVSCSSTNPRQVERGIKIEY